MKAYLKLLRWKNLIIIAITMVMMRFFVLIPIYNFYDVPLFFDGFGFAFLILSVLLIAAGGNVINDYFDRKTDYINRPDNVVVGFKVKRRIVIALHLVLSSLGFFAGIIASVYAGSVMYSLFFLAIILILWKYSTIFKKTVFWGNFIVAILTAFVPFIVGFAEYLAYINNEQLVSIKQFMAIKNTNSIIIGFAVFAFIYNFIREIVKDIEDIEGDAKTGVKTFAVNCGHRLCNFIISSLLFIAVVFLLVLLYSYIQKLGFINYSYFSIIYIWLLIIVPSVFIAVRILFAKEKKHYGFIYFLLKLIMIFGLSFSFIISLFVYGNA